MSPKDAIISFKKGVCYGRKGYYHVESKGAEAITCNLQGIGQTAKTDRSSRYFRFKQKANKKAGKRVKVEGNTGIAHRLRGKPSSRAIPAKIKDRGNYSPRRTRSEI
ncbi:MAG: hypothetical protein AB1422_11745 [bacterium]